MTHLSNIDFKRGASTMNGITCCRKSFLVVILILALVSQNHAEKYIVNVGPGNQLMAGYLGNIGDDNINHWENLGVTWYLNSQGAGDGLTFVQTRNAIIGGFDAWENVATASIDFTYSGSTTSTWSIDSKNVHYWAESGDPIFDPPYNLPSYVLGVTVITINSDEEFTDVDIVFNGKDHTWRVNGTNYDIQAVSAHEIGHLIGLHHTEVSTSPLPTMYGSYQGTDGRSLEFDDEVGASFMYRGNLIDNETLSGTDYYRWSLNQYAGKTLTVQSGSTLKFYSGIKLTINGTLSSVGTAGSRITFTRSGSSGSWYGIRFESGSGGTIKYADIERATYGVYCYYASPNILDNSFTNNNYGIYLNNSNATIERNTLSSDKLSMYSSNPSLDSNLVTGKVYLNNSDPYMFDNRLTSNYLQLYASSPDLFYNTVVGSGIFAVWADNYSSPQFGQESPSQNGFNRMGPVYDLITLYATNHSQPFLGTGYDSEYQIGGSSSVLADAEAAALAATDGTSIIEADYTWWGESSPSPARFSGNVNHGGELSSDPGGGSSLDKSIGGLQVNAPPTIPLPDTNSAEWLWYHGKHLWYRLQSDKALGIFNKLISDFSSTPQAHFALAKLPDVYQVKAIDGLSYDLASLDQELFDNELRAAALDLLTLEYLRAGDINLARQTAENIVRRFPDTEHEYTALFNLFNIYRLDLNDNSSAQQMLARLVEKYPDYSLTLWAQEEMGENVDWSVAKRYGMPEGMLAQQIAIPVGYSLEVNYPNPFNPSTVIPFSLPADSRVTLVVYDILGREVARLVDGHTPAGFHHAVWNGKDLSGNSVASGVYIASIQANQFRQSRKMLYMK